MIRKYQPAGRINSANESEKLTEMPHFTEYEFSRAIYKLLPHGMETAIAERIGKSVSLIVQMYSPDAERQSNLYKAATELSAWIEKDPDTGCKALTLFNTYVKRAVPDKDLCVEKTRRNRFKERMDADLAEAEGKSLDEQIEELEQE
jgi:hypothetical protein